MNMRIARFGILVPDQDFGHVFDLLQPLAPYPPFME